MDARVKRRPEDIRQARLDNPTMRERDLALQLGISEAELVAAEVGVRRGASSRVSANCSASWKSSAR